MQKKKYRISVTLGVILTVIAVFFDLAQIVLTIEEIATAPTIALSILGAAVDYAISATAFLVFWITALITGINFRDKKSFVSLLVTFIIKMTPILQGLPAFTTEVLLMWSIIRAEDVIKNNTGIDVEKLATDTIGAVPGAQTALNAASGTHQAPTVTAGITGTVGKSVGEMVQ